MFVLIHDLFYIVKYERKKVLFYFLLLMFVLLINRLLRNEISADFLTKILFPKYVLEDYDIFGKIIFFLTLIIFLFIPFNIFYNDIKSNYTNLFLRINVKKWAFYKLLFTFIYDIFLIVISNLIVFLFNFNFWNFIFDLDYNLKKFLYFLILQILTFDLIYLYTRSNVLFYCVSILSIVILFVYSNFINVDIVILIITYLMILLSFYILSNKKNIVL